MELETILVPTDFSEHAAHAFQWALAIAGDHSKVGAISDHEPSAVSVFSIPQ